MIKILVYKLGYYLAAFALLCLCKGSYAVDESRLWLPKRYQIHYLELLQAAAAAEALERCLKIVEGTIDRERSQAEHPIFRILCHQENGKTYNEMVDGLSFKTLTTVIKKEEELSAVERAILYQQRQAKKAEFWSRCYTLIETKINKMQGVKWLVQLPPEAEAFDEESAQFTADFDAQNMYRESLHYRVECAVTQDSEPQVSLFRRPAEQTSKGRDN